MPDRPTSSTELIAGIALFQGLTPIQIAHLATHTTRQSYSKDTVVFDLHSEADRFYIVEDGVVSLAVPADSGPIEKVTYVQKMDPFGVLSFFGLEKHDMRAVAETDCILHELTRAGLGEALKADPNILTLIAANLTRTVKHYADQVVAATLLDLEGRLARELLFLRGKRIPSQAGLATLVGASRGAVNAVLSNWRRDGIVKMRWGKLDVMNPDELSRRAQVPPERLAAYLKALGPNEVFAG